MNTEQILNSTSAQIGYTVPCTLVHDGKYRTEDTLKADTTKTKGNPEKANTKHSKTKLPWFSRLIRHSTRNEWVSEQCFMSPPTQYRLYRKRGGYSTTLPNPHGAFKERIGNVWNLHHWQEQDIERGSFQEVMLRWAVCNGELCDCLIFGIFHLKWYSLLHFLDIYIFSTKWTSKYMYLSRLWNRHRMRSSLTMSTMPQSQQISVYLKQAVCSEEVWTQRSLLPASAMALYNNVAPGTVMGTLASLEVNMVTNGQLIWLLLKGKFIVTIEISLWSWTKIPAHKKFIKLLTKKKLLHACFVSQLGWETWRHEYSLWGEKTIKVG